MRHIEQYFSLIIRIIYRSIAVDDKVTYIVDNPLRGSPETGGGSSYDKREAEN